MKNFLLLAAFMITLRLDTLKCRYLDPGDHVDLLHTHPADKGWTTETLVQDATVTAKKTAGGKTELTLSVTRKNADAYALASKKGGVFAVSARSKEDVEIVEFVPASFLRLFR